MTVFWLACLTVLAGSILGSFSSYVSSYFHGVRAKKDAEEYRIALETLRPIQTRNQPSYPGHGLEQVNLRRPKELRKLPKNRKSEPRPVGMF